MSRSGYSEDYGCDDHWTAIMWRGAVASAIKGKRGQAFLKEMLVAMDALPDKRLISHDLEKEGSFCAIGTVGKARGVDMSKLDPEDREFIAGTFKIAAALVAEIEFENDDDFGFQRSETPESRFERMRRWVVANIREPAV